jgi:hypothetical protein
MNQPQQVPPLGAVVEAFCSAAEYIVNDGMRFARDDDPHRYATLPREFDDGRAVRRLQLDYISGGRIRIALLLIGTSGGEPKTIEVFSTMVQGPVNDLPGH